MLTSALLCLCLCPFAGACSCCRTARPSTARLCNSSAAHAPVAARCCLNTRQHFEMPVVAQQLFWDSDAAAVGCSSVLRISDINATGSGRDLAEAGCGTCDEQYMNILNPTWRPACIPVALLLALPFALNRLGDVDGCLGFKAGAKLFDACLRGWCATLVCGGAANACCC
jgi:hypothetical protein